MTTKNKSADLNEAPARDTQHDSFYDTANKCARSTIGIIDAIAARGVFKGEELLHVGQLRVQATEIIQMAEGYAQAQASA